MVGVRYRFLWPVALISLSLVMLCAFMAVSLFHQQAAIASVLRENVASRRAATELEECLTDLIALEKDRVENVTALHDRVRLHLQTLGQFADQSEERDLYNRLSGSFAGYLAAWQAMPAPGQPGHEQAFREATRILETQVLRPCIEFERYNGGRIEDTTDHHERVLRQLAWGMAGIGGMGGVAGVVIGFGVARGLTRSIHRLKVQIQDAAGKLGTDFPEIVLRKEGDFPELHEEVERLTERIEAVVQELQQREYEVLRAEQLAAVGQLAAGVAHEIRNPLTSIKMLVQAGLEEEDPHKLGPDDLHVIEAEVRRMERSLQTFLDFARPAKPRRRPVELGHVVEAVLGLIRGRAIKQRVDVHFERGPAPIVLIADADQIQQVLVNLVLNALDAMPTGGSLTIYVGRRTDGGVTIEVADTGPGVAKESMPRLFEPFFSTKETGLGLGLVISRRVVEDHGGTLTASNRPSGGASFFVQLPPDSPIRRGNNGNLTGR
jgi:signal transduction histidine kinase